MKKSAKIMIFALIVFALCATGTVIYLKGLTAGELNAIFAGFSDIDRGPQRYAMAGAGLGMGLIYLIFKFWHFNALWQEDKRPEQWWRIRF